MKLDLVTERSYILQLSTRLQMFSQVRNDLWESRCPLCGDSKKSETKKRFYIYKKSGKDYYSVKCHNCGYAHPFMTFLKTQFPSVYSQMTMDRFVPPADKKATQAPTKVTNKPINLLKFTEGGYDFSGLIKLTDLPPEHEAVRYIANRFIPRIWWERHIYYCEDFSSFLYSIGERERAEKYEHDKRIVIPFYMPDGQSYVFQGRSLDPYSSLRYITIKKEDDKPKIWGLDRIKKTLPVLALEGPFDAMFLPNAIAMGGSSVQPPKDLNLIYVLDNEPRNKEIVKIAEKLLKRKETVVLWPHSIKEKDVNNMVEAGMTVKQILKIIMDNRWSGLAGELQLKKWKRC